MNTYVVAVAAALGTGAFFFTTPGPETGDRNSAGPSVFSEGQYGAAYQTRKGMFFGLRDVTVTGRTEDVSARILWQNGPQEPGAPRVSPSPFHVEVDIETGSFDSGNGSRDRHVVEILGAPEHTSIRFTSDPMFGRDFASDIERGAGRLTGQLNIAGRQVPVEFDLRFAREDVQDGGEVLVEGQMQTTFSALGVEVPSVGPGGLIAAPTDDLALFVRLQLSPIPGAERVIGLLPYGEHSASAHTL